MFNGNGSLPVSVQTCHLTCVVNQQLPVFSQPQIVRFAMESWLHLRQHCGMKLYGYVIMEEHLHFLAQADRLDQCLAVFMEQTAKLAVEYLQEQQPKRFPGLLSAGVASVYGDEAVRKTLDYIHINPVKRGYVDKPANWRYSSARDYAGEAGLIDIDRFD
jgi:REP element-mobilizing transposase RayT